ncbi:helix-turn-helix domain-containing protein [Bdellovibrio bacteriovorus]|uniref:DNA-3-methyladenine glycosylase 2 family protein n=1 Tax=Bdellovibrio bacteriovorus TaxID=959 RepID=UPI0021D3D752|nr:Ada metal-binding domain-containing protein [Bdellovibrio bacteriovorus]UXR66065.1 helix-turn-helix domain-containing protein [Bdellovibrio bacteriovorus]
MKKSDIYYEAMKARDHRFDGKFFVGVKTTGIYCRPICPAKPKKENVEFFNSHLEAEKAGYRPCLRCRPESAPQSPAWVGKSAVVQRAVKVLNSQETLEFNEDDFAALFGVSARHLRRLFIDEIGKTPKQLSFENRLNLARKLIVETSLPVTEVAFAAGFDSIRRFNDSFKDRFKKAPRDLRRQKSEVSDGLCVTLAYRPPFDFAGLLNSYKNHRVGSLEWFLEDKMIRVIAIDGKVGTVTISDDPARSSLMLEIDFPDTSMIHSIISRVRNLFDLDSDPVIVANCLESDKELKKMLQIYPGIRLPSGWDPFEVAISAILGQLVSVERGRALVADLIELAGKDSGFILNNTRIKLFPTAQDILACDLQSLKTTTIRKQTLREFSKALAEKKISLQPTQDVDQFLKDIQNIRGIGPWTAHYMALKVLRHTDTFPATDLILARALEKHHKLKLKELSPWRGYVAALFWRNYAHTLTKKKSVKKKGRSHDKSTT